MSGVDPLAAIYKLIDEFQAQRIAPREMSLQCYDVMREAVHRSATGRRYLILHGDKFDNVIYFAPWLAKLGDWAYERLMDMNGPVNAMRRVLGFGKWSLSAYMKHKVKKAVEFISRFEEAVVREAHARGCQGVICGHIHTPDDRIINGIHYLNDGDWVESCTALVEHFDGRFEIIRWSKQRPETIRQLVEEPATHSPEHLILIHLR